MRSKTVILLRWKITGRVEHFTNLGKLYSQYKNDELGVARYTLDRKNLYEGYHNDTVEIYKSYIK